MILQEFSEGKQSSRYWNILVQVCGMHTIRACPVRYPVKRISSEEVSAIYLPFHTRVSFSYFIDFYFYSHISNYVKLKSATNTLKAFYVTTKDPLSGNNIGSIVTKAGKKGSTA